jgi:hypothetical protein
MQQVFAAVVGILLLTLGWRLFWMFVGVLGFVAGLQMAQSLWVQQPFWMLWVAGLVCGFLGAILALFLQHLAVAIGGFVAGGILALQLVAMLGYSVSGLIALIGGILGAVALVLFFDWALVVLSSMVGAAFIVDAIGGGRFPYAPWLFVAVAAAGVIFQSRLLMASRKTMH